MSLAPILHWFRRDLRLADQPALSWIAAQQAPLLAVYIHAPEEEGHWPPGAASRWWLHHSLSALQQQLAAQQQDLTYFAGDSAACLMALCAASGARQVSWNRRYEPHLVARDGEVRQKLEKQGIEVEEFDDGILFPPGELLNRQHLPYRVFTPFWREARRRLASLPAVAPQASPRPRLAQEPCASPLPGQLSLAQLGLLSHHSWEDKLARFHQPGELSSRQHWRRFLNQRLIDYTHARDIPALEGTSGLSAALHFGEISVFRLLHDLQPLLQGEGGAALSGSAERFLSQLGWREFGRHLLHHFPHSDQQSLNPGFGAEMWRHDPAGVHRWQQGTTGIPLVDAGMRELWESGNMHNRLRMLVGSLLCKNLGIHWRAGAEWFWDTLVDADLANNSMGWQWIAGCGVDAAPYFRIFNPLTQAEKFDPQGLYQRRWLASRVPIEPILDLKRSRELALERYKTHVSAKRLSSPE